MSFTAKGRKVFQDPTRKTNPDGTTSLGVGFPVFELTDWVEEEAAEQIAAHLNAHDEMAAELKVLRATTERERDAARQAAIKECAAIVESYGKAAHGQSLRMMAPVVRKSILRLLEGGVK